MKGMVGLFVSIGSVAKITAPIWAMNAYLMDHRKTFIPMFSAAALYFFCLILLLILFKRLNPDLYRDKEEHNNPLLNGANSQTARAVSPSPSPEDFMS